MKRKNWLRLLMVLLLCLMPAAVTSAQAEADLLAGECGMLADNAQIIEKYKAASDAEKLEGYRTEICALLSADDAVCCEAVNAGETGQQLCVFDHDPEAGAAHEGCANAFQQLCDLSAFSEDVRCYTVWGTLQCGELIGPHMWNIVQINGDNYLADIANSDEGCIGQDGGLFLIADVDGEWDDRYTVTANGKTLSYAYAAEVRELWGEEILRLGRHVHLWTGGSCTVPGTCSFCGTVRENAPGHKWAEGSCTVPAVCSVCGAAAGSAAGHVYGAPVFVWTSDGQASATFTCTRCSANTPGHALTRNAAVARTAFDPGSCLSESSVTCKATVEWSGRTYTETRTFEESRGAHILVQVAGKAASCAGEGRAAHYRCSVCHGLFADENGTRALSPADVIIASDGHIAGSPLVSKEVPATCTDHGSYEKTVTCATCGREISRETVIVGATGHAPGEPVTENKIDASCTAGGSYDQVVRCRACGAEMQRQTTVIPAAGHTAGEPVITNEVPATCTTDGSYDLVESCQQCGREISRSHTVIGVIGHAYSAAVTEPTCTAGGYTIYTCTACGDHYQGDHTAALGHVEKEATVEKETAATCSKDGMIESAVYCAACGTRLRTETTILKATGNHVYAYESARQEPACTEAGRLVMACGCGATQQTVLPAKGHTAGNAVIANEAAPGCTTPGSYDAVVNCTACGAELSRQTTVIGAKGHVPGNAVTVNEVAPGCTTPGSYDTVVNCTVCGVEISRQTTTIGAAGHTPGNSTITNEVAPGCTTAGRYDTIVSCTACGGEVSRQTTTVGAKGHTPGNSMITNEVAPGCTTPGSYDIVVSCAACGGEVSRQTMVIGATGHTPPNADGVCTSCQSPV